MDRYKYLAFEISYLNLSLILLIKIYKQFNFFFETKAIKAFSQQMERTVANQGHVKFGLLDPGG